ncbi:hypothetical protein [Promicromonospora iranensis]|uniref:Uncharacterized protein n=1 Tax=Promicromonospora iranensis TaxID=1105144 RepID=A0ABU2CHX5_9MICO|nr:hypothetical protein [Promicromonospora iranensis]MDR7380933.1 hypothetical protein [Promicromonospora iranensis]
MSDGFMIWFLRGEPTERVVDHLAATGATLAYPIGEGQVSVIDLEGTREIISSECFVPLLEDNDSPSLTFQMWYSKSEDMVVTVRRNLTETSSGTAFYSVTCYLDGLEFHQVESAISGADQLASASSDEVIGIVIDKRGSTEDFDWDAFIADPSTTPPAPERLVVRRDAIEHHAADHAAWSLGNPTAELATHIDVQTGLGR